MAQMGIGTSILGYANEEVDTAVKEMINDGINTTLNSPEEVYLADKLLNHNPNYSSVKFARTGGEAMAIAVRIARAYSNKDKVAFSGYHGWCDWYLSTNLSGDNKLKDHLLPGLSPKGVPRSLKNSAIPFKYNNVNDLKKVFNDNPDIGTIIIEGARYELPSTEFLLLIKEISKKNDIIIICDEITSGWRITDGGVYKTNNLNPDIVVYGKGMGNGYAISSIIGKKYIMDIAQDTFISSTFWTERVGFVAALKTIEVFTLNKVWEHLIDIGTMIGDGWLKIAKKHGVDILVGEMKPLINMTFNYNKMNSAIKTLFTQEMFKRGYLASTSIYVSYCHTEEIVEKYLYDVDKVFEIISIAIEKNQINELLETKIQKDGFQRLN